MCGLTRSAAASMSSNAGIVGIRITPEEQIAKDRVNTTLMDRKVNSDKDLNCHERLGILPMMRLCNIAEKG
jgi:hypothetical protein